MQKKKIFIIAVLTITAALTITGCSDAKKETAKETTETTAAVTTEAAPAEEKPSFQEFPIGDEIEAEGLNIAAVYLKPVDMEPSMKGGLSADKADIHLEADISALKDNPHGFGAGEFVPYLTVKYQILDDKKAELLSGSLMPMNAADGSHYGINVKMPGAGNYKLKFFIESPEKQDFLLHTDKDTGVPGRFWKKAIEAEFDFPYVPRKF